VQVDLPAQRVSACIDLRGVEGRRVAAHAVDREDLVLEL
jgi:hypothetical protein